MPKTTEEKAIAMLRSSKVRHIVAKYRIRYYEIADALGCSYVTLNRWMRLGLDEGKYARVMDAIGQLTGGDVNG